MSKKRLEDLTEELPAETLDVSPAATADEPPAETAIDAPVEVATAVFRRSQMREMVDYYAQLQGVKPAAVDVYKLRQERGVPNPTALFRVSFVGTDAIEPINIEAVDESEAIRKALISRRVARPSRVTTRVVLVAD